MNVCMCVKETPVSPHSPRCISRQLPLISSHGSSRKGRKTNLSETRAASAAFNSGTALSPPLPMIICLFIIHKITSKRPPTLKNPSLLFYNLSPTSSSLLSAGLTHSTQICLTAFAYVRFFFLFVCFLEHGLSEPNLLCSLLLDDT